MTVYRFARTWLMTSTLVGLIGFTLAPTAPPRLLAGGHGFVDTMAQYSSYGWWGGDASAPRGLGGLTNQYAAMPSLHVGWSLWCGIVLWRYGRTRFVRALGIAYPLGTTLVVMGTANHYFLDALAGCGGHGPGLPAHAALPARRGRPAGRRHRTARPPGAPRLLHRHHLLPRRLPRKAPGRAPGGARGRPGPAGGPATGPGIPRLNRGGPRCRWGVRDLRG